MSYRTTERVSINPRGGLGPQGDWGPFRMEIWCSIGYHPLQVPGFELFQLLQYGYTRQSVSPSVGRSAFRSTSSKPTYFIYVDNTYYSPCPHLDLSVPHSGFYPQIHNWTLTCQCRLSSLNSIEGSPARLKCHGSRFFHKDKKFQLWQSVYDICNKSLKKLYI